MRISCAEIPRISSRGRLYGRLRISDCSPLDVLFRTLFSFWCVYPWVSLRLPTVIMFRPFRAIPFIQVSSSLLLPASLTFSSPGLYVPSKTVPSPRHLFTLSPFLPFYLRLSVTQSHSLSVSLVIFVSLDYFALSGLEFLLG